MRNRGVTVMGKKGGKGGPRGGVEENSGEKKGEWGPRKPKRGREGEKTGGNMRGRTGGAGGRRGAEGRGGGLTRVHSGVGPSVVGTNRAAAWPVCLMISLRNHGWHLAGNGLVLVKSNIPLCLKPSACNSLTKQQ